MNIDKFINSTMKSYDEYRKNCDIIAKEAQRYIDFDDFVSCEYINGTGLSILITYLKQMIILFLNVYVLYYGSLNMPKVRTNYQWMTLKNYHYE